MIRYIVISDKPLDFLPASNDVLHMNATDFISNQGTTDLRKAAGAKVVNLCGQFEYLSTGYYCSLLAQARGMRCVPDVNHIVTLNWKRLYQNHLPELNELLKATYNKNDDDDEPLSKTYIVYFGRTRHPALEAVARRVFDLFRFPLLNIEIALDAKGEWSIRTIEPMSISDLPKQRQPFFAEALKKFTGSAWRKSGGTKYKDWIAILHDPQEKNPPSNKEALKKFIKAGKDLNIAVELITRNDLANVSEYDALFIRETTAINNHTFRFAKKAESEFIPVIDDTDSIIRCCNKVFQYELLESRKIPLPKTHIIDRKNFKQMADTVSYPAVVKIPDGAFSRGVIKVESRDAFLAAAAELLKNSAIILVQEFISSEFDWRIGVINGQPLFACKYYMAEGHWQIYNHSAKTLKKTEGDSETLAVSDVPAPVMQTALKAAKLMGTGLYGVDLKQSGKTVVVMEVNDNPNIDAGVEDLVLGDELYRMVLQELAKRIYA